MDTYAVLARKHLETVLDERDHPARPDPTPRWRPERRRALARTLASLRTRYGRSRRPAPACPLPSPKVIPGH